MRPARVAAIGALGLAGALTGCSSKAPAAGVARIDRSVVVAFKPCDAPADLGLASLELRGSDDPDHVVWRAAHVDGRPAPLELPIVDRYPGYRISGSARLDGDQTYSIDAVATDGTEWGGPSFRLGDLRQGEIRVAGRSVRFAEWVDEPASCPDVTFWGALATGLVVAAVAGGALVAARGIRRAVRAARRAP